MTHHTYYDRFKARHRAGHRAKHRKPSTWQRLTCTAELLLMRAFVTYDARVSLALGGWAR